MRFRLSNPAILLCSSVVLSVLVYLFYASPLRARVEMKLFDLRSRLAPEQVPDVPVVVISIDQTSIDLLNAKLPLAPWEKKDHTDLSPEALLTVLEALLASPARSVSVLLPSQVYNYDDPRLDQVTALAQKDHRLLLGTFDQSLLEGEISSPSRLLLTGADHLYKADIKRSYRRDIIRSLTIFERQEMPYLLGGLAPDLSPGDLQAFAQGDRSSFELNYAYKNRIAQIPAETIVNDPGAFDLHDATLLVGYTAYRPLTLANREATYVNTPWQTEGDDVAGGLPLVIVQAIGLVNLLERSWLRPAPLFVSLLETVVLAGLALAAWQLSISVACLLFLAGWSLLLLAHAVVFSYLHVHVPLADSLLWSALATYSGALLRLRLEARWRTTETAKLKVDQELVSTQDRFLSRFSSELASINDRIAALLTGMTPQLQQSALQATQAHAKALSSSEELRDYLAGMGQVAFLTQTNAALPKLRQIDLDEAVQTVVRQLEQKAQDAKVRFKIVYRGEVKALADLTLVTQILYNVVANAVQYSPSGTEVVISVVRTKSEVHLSVTDQGVGIEPAHHDRIFEKFYRVKSDFVYKSKGHGLGLYLSRYFAKRMGAEISLNSVPGQGSTFTLHLRTGKFA